MVIETELFDSPDLNPLVFYLSGWMKSRVCKTKGGYNRRIARSHLDDADRTKKREDQFRRTSRDFAHELPSVLRFTAGFWNIYLNCNKLITSTFKKLKLN